MSSTQAFAEAMDEGDYAKALTVYRTMEQAQTPVGKATEAFFLAMSGDHDGAARQIAGCKDAELIEFIVKGERERAKRWTEVEAAGQLTASEPLPYLGVYAGMNVALVQGDKKLIEEQIAPDKAKIPKVAGTLVYRDGRRKPFQSITDSDDGIGAMLETYGPSGLMYMPFAAIRSLTFLPGRNFIDHLVYKAEVALANGTTTMALVPLLYAQSSTAADGTIRAGRMTTWSYVGEARRGLGQRDFVLDGGIMVGMQNVASIELGATTATRPVAKASPLPVARQVSDESTPAASSKNLIVIGLVLVAIVVILAIVMS